MNVYISIWTHIWPHVAISMATDIFHVKNQHLVYLVEILVKFIVKLKGDYYYPRLFQNDTSLVMQVEAESCFGKKHLFAPLQIHSKFPFSKIKKAMWECWTKRKKTQTKQSSLKHTGSMHIYIYVWNYVIGFTADLNQNIFSVSAHILTSYIE